MKPKIAWIILNYSRLFCFGHTRKDAIAECERLVGAPWQECKKYMRVAKVEMHEITK